MLLLVLSGCGFYDSMKAGLEQSQAVADQIEQQIGTRPFVGFHWSNGELDNINVTFDEVPEDTPVDEVISATRASIRTHFEQQPSQIIVSFTLTGHDG